MFTKLLFARGLLTIVLTGSFLVACSRPAQVQQVMVTAPPVVMTQVVESVQPMIVRETVAVSDLVRPTEAPQPTLIKGDSTTATFVDAPVASSRMVIKDADLELLVADTSMALAKVTQLAADSGGYLLSSQVDDRDGLKYATSRMAVPSAKFEATLNSLRNLSVQVLRESATGQDVSAEYVDLQSRLGNLEATAARVREFLAQAKTVEESLRVNKQLSELEGQIAQVKGQMQFYEGRAAFSTITVALTPQRPTQPTPTPTSTSTPTATPTSTPTQTPTPSWNPGTTFTQASGTLVSITQIVVDGLIWVVVVAGPFALMLGVVVGVARGVSQRMTNTTRKN